MSEAYVFISYSSKNYDKALELRKVLTGNGISCWMAPDSIPPSSDYSAEIPKAIKLCNAFVLLLTEDSQESPFVRKELVSAISHKKAVIPLCDAGLKLNESFAFHLADIQIIVADSDTSYRKIISRLKEILPEPEPELIHTGTIISTPLTPKETIIDSFDCLLQNGFGKHFEKGTLQLYNNRMEFETEFGHKTELRIDDIIKCRVSSVISGTKTWIGLAFLIIFLFSLEAFLIAYIEPNAIIFSFICFITGICLSPFSRISIVSITTTEGGKTGIFVKRKFYTIRKVKKANRKSLYSYLKIRLNDKVIAS